jgi:hypothetical protein
MTTNTLVRTLLPIITLASLVLASAQAQSLASLAPANTVLTLSLNSQEVGDQTLGRDLAELDWAGAGAALTKLMTFLAETGGDFDLDDITEILEAISEPGKLFAELEQICPQLTDLSLPFKGFFHNALLTLSFTPFNPLPAVTAFTRVEQDALPAAIELQAALVDCLTVSAPLEQDGIPLYVLGDGGDLPIVIGALDDVFMASSNPEVLRSAIRLHNGGEDASLADTPLWQTSQRLNQSGVGFSLNLAAVAEVLETFSGLVVDGPEIEYLFNRATAALRTLGGVAGSIGASEEGILSEAFIAVDPDGGDSELAALLLCRTCTATTPFLAPENSARVSSQYLPLRELFAYLQGWLDGLAPIIGEDLDLKTLLRDEIGLDLDTALFDWIGSKLHTVMLEGVSSDLKTLLYQAPRVFIVPVSSPEQARVGLDMLGQVLAPFTQEIASGLNPLSMLSDPLDLNLDSFGDGTFVSRPYQYRGVDIERFLTGPNVNVGYAFVGNNLVLGTPAEAIEALIDTFNGDPSIVSNSAYRASKANSPRGSLSLQYSDDRELVSGIAELIDIVAQPIAFGVSAAMQATTEEVAFDESFGSELGFTDLFGLSADLLTAPGALEGTLEESDENNFTDLSDYFELSGLEPGTDVRIELTSDSFDTYLYLIEAESESYLDANDDAPDTSRSELVFTVQPGVTYWVEVTSFSGFDTGPYTLGIETGPSGTFGFAGGGDEFGFTDLFGLNADLLTAPSTLEGTLEESDENNFAELSDYFELSGLEPGTDVRIELTSFSFDTYLYLIEAESESYLDANDDAPDTSRSELAFTVQPGVTYWIEVTSFSGFDTGPYSLSIQTGPEEVEVPGEPAVAPSFAELLTLTSILPQALEILADHLSFSEGYTVIEETGIYSRTLIRIRW